MKKLLISILSVAFLLTACGRHKTVAPAVDNPPLSKGASVVYNPEAATYNEWDRAVRIDTDMQNMFISTPRKIEKPIDMYMAMALALKYNYTRRLVNYEDSLIRAGTSPVNRLPEIVSHAGYINQTNSSAISPDLKVAWNVLDMTMVYCQTRDADYKSSVAFEESRKVIHNILQETRSLYWRTLAAQKLLPVTDDMIEFMTLEVDDMNATAKQLAEKNEQQPVDLLVKKRQYMEAIKKLSSLKRDLETAQTRLSSLMGMHPSTEYELVGSEYGNFELPKIKTSLSDLEWLALNNRPELREHDLGNNPKDLKVIIQEFKQPSEAEYKSDPARYNRMWSKQAKEIGYSVYEDINNPNLKDLAALRRQRMSSLILSQVYVAWAQYMSAVEDYQINMEIANTSENIAEDFTIAKGTKDEKAQLEATRAIGDEVKAFKAYADLQDSLGNLYVSIGLDAIPYYMLNEKPSNIAVYLHNSMQKWGEGDFMPDNRPYLLQVPAKRPPVNLSSSDKLPNIKVETGQHFKVTIPQEMVDRMNFKGKVISRSGLIDDNPLPRWLSYNEETRTFEGTPMPGQEGIYEVKTYFIDESDNIGYTSFKIKVVNVFVPSMNVTGQNSDSSAMVLKRCVGSNCNDNYISASTGR
ncbi:MAG: putative Ig domain-containing protein [Rhodospirillales bacterium]|nr:putative Ig domain-containing protein [Rhodospirillales bacterium]